ncbi:MAG: tryptophan--tRNA ligase [Alphaproteobacteria bacterium]|nr:tryptophan--tRNA ligase [Alphaproteobacteria bacterium]MBN2780324.1 tryptophan--tRNA ligase [Alphaproteobacteria bacterium]
MTKIFSGLKPSGDFTLGNYIGAMKHWVDYQNKVDIKQLLYCIVDLHAITVPQDPKTLHQRIREIAAVYIACGLDPKKSILFLQSHVSAHAELGWILNCTARVGWLNRMTQFKDKAGKNREQASVGLYDYPVLMAADILLYGTTHVPVGEDQKQHVELTRDIAQKFNHDYSTDLFVLPEPAIAKEGARIMGLRDGTNKMSKSGKNPNDVLYLLDSADDIAQKIRKAKTDSDLLPATVQELANRPEAKNLLTIFANLAEKQAQDILNNYAGQNFATFKKDLAEICIEKITPIGNKARDLLKNPKNLDKILKDGAEKANKLATPLLNKVKETVGFV